MWANGPDAKVNLIDHPEYQGQIAALRDTLDRWMADTFDPALAAFRGRNAREAMDRFMDEQARDLHGGGE